MPKLASTSLATRQYGTDQENQPDDGSSAHTEIASAKNISLVTPKSKHKACVCTSSCMLLLLTAPSCALRPGVVVVVFSVKTTGAEETSRMRLLLGNSNATPTKLLLPHDALGSFGCAQRKEVAVEKRMWRLMNSR
ncbi:hypothetical protein GUJ93_ZPchr0001g31310 [Zizania palustris]|uniref:Uncharacterized protein n=1 Tax=Zizania palustris TaxID=103762 RepID=A0A8J5VQK4_ZIZPA|nr:hypothetical protein GUJ93_ZPchr0001g31310 [Zizania palustris]